MPNFDPEKDNGWSLREAVMRTSDPFLLASAAQKRLELGKQPWWWVPTLGPEPLLGRGAKYDYLNPQRDYELTVKALETAFRIKLVKGELVCWAQPATTDAVYRKLNTSAWWALVIDDWWGDTLIEATRDEHHDFVPVAGGTRYYGARIEPPDLHSAAAVEVDPHRTGYPGRPPKGKDLIEDEARRRAKEGKMLPALTAEVKALRDWYVDKYPNVARPQCGTIENNIRQIHRHAFPRK
jgi:hypothetical protein